MYTYIDTAEKDKVNQLYYKAEVIIVKVIKYLLNLLL